jgi:hypothetical protein
MLLFIKGCTYAISPEMVDKVDKTITFEMVQIDPDSYKGSLVIFGGTIKQTTSLAEGTLIDVFEKPLDYWGKPIASSNESAGPCAIGRAVSPRCIYNKNLTDQRRKGNEPAYDSIRTHSGYPYRPGLFLVFDFWADHLVDGRWLLPG